MTKSQRNLVLALCGVVTVGSLIAYAATGAKAFSRSPDPELAQTNTTSDLEDLFADEADMDVPDTPRVQSEFAFGLLPGGPKDPLSVATFVGPAIVVAAGAFYLESRSRKASTNSSPDTPADTTSDAPSDATT